MVGNDFVMPRPQAAKRPVQTRPAVILPQLTPLVSTGVSEEVFEPAERGDHSFVNKAVDLLHRYSLIVFALLLLIVGTSAVQVGAAYWSAHIELANTTTTKTFKTPVQAKQGPNLIVNQADLEATLNKVTSQPLNLTIGSKSVSIPSDTINSWVQTVTDKRTGAAYIHVKQDAITKSLSETAQSYVKTPVNQVTIKRADGSSQVIATGRDGTQIGDIKPIASDISKNLLSAHGMQFNVPIQTLAFSAVDASSIDKMLEVNVTTKHMWAYEKGVLTHDWPISAGAPETPTPIGQFKIYEKLPVQDMKGFNANGTKYFQPHVRWINYFLPGGYAVHGNYWRPTSWFGNINSSHGCVSLPDDQAKQVYDWAPIGTTVITHA